MIHGFEDITAELSQKELTFYIPILIHGFKNKIGYENVVSTPEIISGIHKMELRTNPNAVKLQEPRIRKMAAYIIVNNLVPCLISCRKGFYIATEPQEIDNEIRSLNDRITAMQAKRKAWIRQKEVRFLATQNLFD